jgi:hypothetical protein
MSKRQSGIEKYTETTFYYPVTNKKREHRYRCITHEFGVMGLTDHVKEVPALNVSNHRNFMMNEKFEKTDEDLIKYCNAFIAYNEELKKPFFKKKNGTCFKIDMMNYHSLSDAILNICLMNSDQKRINQLPKIDRNEFKLFQNCKTHGMMVLKDSYKNTTAEVYGYDYSKFYYQIMRKIRIPECEPEYYANYDEELDYDKLKFGLYRVKIHSENKTFLKLFNFNKTHHYSHNTLKILNKFKEKYGITFELLPPDDEYFYSMAVYEKTVELKTLFKEWFAIMDKLLATCGKKNFLIKMLISQIWGHLSQYKKTYVKTDDVGSYNWGNMFELNESNYKYYSLELEYGVHTMIKPEDAYQHGGIARIKPFLTEYARMYVFNMISTNNLGKHVVRVHTDGIIFDKPINFDHFKMDYRPIPEKKTTGILKFYTLNCYVHVCLDCDEEYKYDKNNTHKCADTCCSN